MTENNRNRITILGIGNTLYTDEGLGVHALAALEEFKVNNENYY